jgi:hypothetical protein
MSENAGEALDPRDDLIVGMAAIAEFWGMPERKVRYLADQRRLPGAFQMEGGREWFQSKSEGRAGIRARARRGQE